jgi:hypothetical protein
MAYSATTDLLNGNIPLPSYVNTQKYVDDAADEIDSKIGFIYQTPIDVTTNSLVPRPARLLLKRINNFLATGRILMAVDAGGEEVQVHAYAASLIRDANAALDMIVSGDVIIEGAVRLDTGDAAQVTAIIVNNLDPESNVEAFYDRIANPSYVYPYGGSAGESLVR